jgi:uncharacterized integral membrane protein (TIGR00698 family)
LPESPSLIARGRSIVPGLILLLVVAAAAALLVQGLGRLPGRFGQLPLSMMLIAVLAGLALSGSAQSKVSWQPGLAVARGPLLKIAVALIGLRLSLSDLGQLGWQALPLVAAMLVAALAVTLLFARLAGANLRLAILLTAGTAICGASAIAATAPGLRARAEETAYAIACVAVIGLLATLVYPALLQALLNSPEQIGLVIGVAIHDTAQVTAAAVLHEQLYHSEGTLTSATVAKLMRNSTMLVVIPALVWLANRGQPRDTASPPFPLFIVAFIVLSGLRSLGDAWLGSEQALWHGLIEWAGHFSLIAFTMAMAALAMGIRFGQLRNLGWKPALAAFAAAATVLALAIGWVH